jgi:hypothetical protein
MDLDLRQLRYFLVVAEELHFTRAAERLFMAQPALSKAIRRLEQAVGVPLFTRTTHEVRLTAAGEAFARHARRAVREIDPGRDVAAAADLPAAVDAAGRRNQDIHTRDATDLQPDAVLPSNFVQQLVPVSRRGAVRILVVRADDGAAMIVVLRAVQVLVAALLAVTSLAAFAGPAHAVTPMTCNKNGAAPSSSGSGGVITYYYSHRCNYVPNGVEMIELLSLEFSPTSSGSSCSTGDHANRYYEQTAVDFSDTYSIGSCHGYWTPVMVLIIRGDFSYGSVPGCSRYSGKEVYCDWRGVTAYY